MPSSSRGSDCQLTEVIPLRPGEILHVNAMRIGFKPAAIDYAGGRVVSQAAQ